MEPWSYYGEPRALDTDTAESTSWAYILWSFIFFTALIYLMCHTADNYFSPVLAAMCDLLDMAPEIAGVTFLAFGNGAPDVFSAFVALSSTADKEDGLLVGMGSLLGSSIFTVTLIVGSVLYIKPTKVPPVSFTRDLVFLLLGLVLVLISTFIGSVPIAMSSAYLLLYVVYVAIVFKGPTGRSKSSAGVVAPSTSSSQDGLEVGQLGPGTDDHAEGARWINGGGGEGVGAGADAGEERFGFDVGDGGDAKGDGAPSSVPHRGGLSNGSSGIGAGAAGGSVDAKYGGARRGGDAVGPAAGAGAAAGAVGKPAPPAAVRDDFSAGGNSLRHDYFGGAPESEDGDDEERSLLGAADGGGRVGGRRVWSSRGKGAGGGGGGGLLDGGELEGEALARVPGSTVSMFSEDDDSAATWLAQRRWGGGSGVWGRQQYPKYGEDGEMCEPLLDGKRARGGRPGLRSYGPSDYSREPSIVKRRFEHAWETIQWRQWRLRRRIRRQLGNSDVLQLPLYRQLLWAVELPTILIRNATIPPVEKDSWSQAQAAISTALAPALIFWAFGWWSVSLGGGLTCGWVVLLAGLPIGVAVWLTTHKRRMPEDRWYRLALVMVSFISCVAWIYFFADQAVTTIDEIGTSTGISTTVLGLTLLAWGNSSGDLITNIAVAKAGFPGMAISGSYGGPLFNILIGVGLPMFYGALKLYPEAPVFELDSSLFFTVCMIIVVLVGTLPAVVLSGFRFPAKTPIVLLVAYVVYMVGAMYLTLTFGG